MTEQTEFPLWQFNIRDKDTDFGFGVIEVVTRGTLPQAKQYICTLYGNVIITPLTFTDINANKLYEINHAPGWYNRPMKWLEALND